MSVVLLLACLVVVASEAVVPATFSFAVSGDHTATSATDGSLAALDASGVNFYVAIGDLNYEENDSVPTPTAWCDYMKAGLPTLGASFPFEVLAGNHDETVWQEYANCFPDRLGSTLGPSNLYGTEYFFDYPAASPLMRMILISPALTINNVSYSYSPGSTRYNWVAGAIDAARADGIPWIVVGMHKHCFTSSSSSCEIGTGLMNMLVSKKVDLVLQGHKHTYQRSKQLAHGAACPAAAGTYDADCIVDSGSDGLYVKGRGTIVSIIGCFGKGGSSSAGQYFAKAGNGDGFTKFTVSATQIDAQFVNTSSSFTDSYSIRPNRPPVVQVPAHQTDVEQAVVSLPVVAVDPDGDVLTYSATGLPPGLTINATGIISGTLASGSSAGTPYTVVVTVTDVGALSTSVSFTWAVNDPPPGAPTGLTFTRQTSGLQLDWADHVETDVVGYDVYRSAGQSGPFVKVHAGHIGPSGYFDGGAPAGATSYYQVKAIDGSDNASLPAAGSARRSSIAFVSAATSAGSDLRLVLPQPAGIAPGDVLLAGITARGTAAIIPPLGWKSVSQTSRTLSLSQQQVFSHTVSVTDAAGPYTFVLVGRPGAVGVVAAYRGAVEASATAAAQANPASTSITAPSITPLANGSAEVAFFGIETDATIVPPAGMVGRGSQLLTLASLDVALAVADVIGDAVSLPQRVATASKPAESFGQVVALSPVSQ